MARKKKKCRAVYRTGRNIRLKKLRKKSNKQIDNILINAPRPDIQAKKVTKLNFREL